MESLKHVRFFAANPKFAITSPEPFAYGGGAIIEPDLDRISWCDARHHEIVVQRVGESTRQKLVVYDNLGRRFAFEPMTVGHWQRRFPQYANLRTVDEILAFLDRDQPG